MAPHGKEMRPDVKSLIIQLSKKGYNHTIISEITGRNRRIISKFLQPSQHLKSKHGNIQRGRKRKTDSRDEKDLFRLVRKKQNTDFRRSYKI